MVAPSSLYIEATTRCQLNCPGCKTASGELSRVSGTGCLDPADFASVLDRNPSVKHVELSNNGEIFLNPNLADIIRIGYEHGVRLTAGNGVNFNSVSQGALEALVKYGFFGMTISIDGATQNVYSQYRRRGSIDQVFANIRALNDLKKKYDTPLPHLIWQYIVFGHNEDEMISAAFLAQKLGLGIRYKLSWDSRFSPVRDTERLRKILGAASREEFEQKYKIHYMAPICLQLWKSPVINWDGRVPGCCKNWWSHFEGNVFSDGLQETLHNPMISQVREALSGKADMPGNAPCSQCEVYSWRKNRDRWITCDEIAHASNTIDGVL